MLLCASPTSATSAALASLCHRLPPQKPFVSSNPNPNPNCSLIRSSSLPLHKPQTPPKKPPLHSLSASDALETIADEVEDEEEEKQIGSSRANYVESLIEKNPAERIPPRPNLLIPFSTRRITHRESTRRPIADRTRSMEQFLQTLFERSQFDKLALLLQYGAILASVEAPATWAVTGNNNEDDLVTTLISAGVIAFLYFFVAPPIIMNWMRLRWYKRKFLEMFLQFMCVFVFFPGLMLWAPFLNFRKFPRDPTMKYPWSTPKDDVPLYKSR